MAHLIRSARDRAGLRLSEVASLLGYPNINKTCRLIESLERGERHNLREASRLCAIYGVPEADLLEAERADLAARLAAFEAWVSVPQRPRMVVRVLPAIYLTVLLPDQLTDDFALEAHACEYSRRNNSRACLQLNRRHTLWTDETGAVISRTEATPHGFPSGPSMTLGGKRIHF